MEIHPSVEGKEWQHVEIGANDKELYQLYSFVSEKAAKEEIITVLRALDEPDPDPSRLSAKQRDRNCVCLTM